MAKIPKCDIGNWYRHYISTLDDYNLVKDELIAEEIGRHNVFRRKHNGRGLSSKGVHSKLNMIVEKRDTYHGEVPIQERRQHFTGIMIDRKTSGSAIGDWLEKKYSGWRGFGEGKVENEVLASFLVCSGPRNFAKKLVILPWGEYTAPAGINCHGHTSGDDEYWTGSIAQHPPWVNISLPICALIFTEIEAKNIVDSLLVQLNNLISTKSIIGDGEEYSTYSSDIDKLDWKVPISGKRSHKDTPASENFRTGEDVFWPPVRTSSSVDIGAIFLKFPSLFDVAKKLGWEISDQPFPLYGEKFSSREETGYYLVKSK